jgi:hypothetical protein
MGHEHVAAGPAHEISAAGVAEKAMMPAMEMKEAADIQSAAVAMPLGSAPMPLPAT